MSLINSLISKLVHKPEQVKACVQDAIEYESMKEGWNARNNKEAPKMTNEELYAKRRELVDKAVVDLRAHYELALGKIEKALAAEAENLEKRIVLVEARELVIRDHSNIILAALRDAGHNETATALAQRLRALTAETKK